MPALAQSAVNHLARRYVYYGYYNYGLWGGLSFLFFLLIVVAICCYRSKREQQVVAVPVQQVVYTQQEVLPMYTVAPTPAYATYGTEQVLYTHAQPQQQVIYAQQPLQQQQQQQQFRQAVGGPDAGTDRLGTYSPPAFENPNYYPVAQSSQQVDAPIQLPQSHAATPPAAAAAAAASPASGQPVKRPPTPESYYR
ncbi:hypothetical protein BDR26DRAFT_895103 [Obelidium mucronatum]|nr:hypothetical protein BDR26DRAFT_895103 [Obelidium mucronatum]